MAINGHRCTISASIGVDIFPGGGKDNDTMLAKADAALYQAKRAGKNTYRMTSPTAPTGSETRVCECASRRIAPGPAQAHRRPPQGPPDAPGRRPAPVAPTMPDVNEPTWLSPSAFQKLQDELEQLTSAGRREMEERLAEARAHGDISENADYDAAKEEQGLMEARIRKIRHLLRTAEVREAGNGDTVDVGSVVAVRDVRAADGRKELAV